MAIKTVNPATGETLKEFAPLTAQEIETKLALAAAAFATHRRTTFAERAAKVLRAAEILDARKEEFARLMTIEMGKPVGAAREEVVKCAWVCRYYAETAEKHLADETVESSATRSYVSFRPVGSVLAVMPWNFPFWQVFRFAAPALMAGNVGLLKHASNVPQSALGIEEIFRRGSLPDPAHRRRRGRGDHRRRARRGRDADRERSGGRERGGHRGPRDQKERARTRRQRPVRRDAERESGRGGRGGRPLAHNQQRAVVHRRQALHRTRSGLRGVRAEAQRRDGGA
jgi:hypothetical protein